MSLKSFFILVTSAICVAVVAVMFVSKDSSQTEQIEEVSQQPSVSTNAEPLKEDVASTSETTEEGVASAPRVADASKKPVQQVQKTTPVREPVVQEPASDVTSSGIRLANNGERTNMKQAVYDFLDIIKTGTRDEIKAAVGYEAVTPDQKKEFDDMSDEELRSAMDFMAMILEDIPHALDNPDEYTTSIALQPNNIYAVEIMNGKDKESSSESYELTFKVIGGKWVMASPL